MAQLSSVIGSILRDIISAQHEANLYSLTLSESYGKDGKTKDFQLPNVAISDMELELKYAVTDTSENQEQFNIRYSKFRRFIGEVCQEAARTAITTVVSVVLSSSIRREESDKQFFYRLKQETALNRSFFAFLSRCMRHAFVNNLYESVNRTTGDVQTDVLCNKLVSVVDSKFLGDQDLDALFRDADGEALRAEAHEQVRTALDGLVRKMSEGENFKRRKSFPKLEVAVTASELERLPEESVHTFRLKFSPVSCSISDSDPMEEIEDFSMQ